MSQFFKSDKDVDESAAQFQGIESDPHPVIPMPKSVSPTPAASSVPVAPKEKPNVILAGNRLAEALPEGMANIGTIGVMIPSAEEQAKGFFVELHKAGVFVAQFRQFKFLVEKGQATPPVKIGE